MDEALVRLLAEHYGLELREDLAPEQDDLDEEPDVQPVGTVTDRHLRWLYGLAYQAFERHEEQVRLLKGPAAGRPRQVRAARSLTIELMSAFERSVRERFGVHDDADLTVTRDWKVYTWAKRCGCGCGECGDGCEDGCKGGCDCEQDEAEQPEDCRTIAFMLSPESYRGLLATCVSLMVTPAFRMDPEKDIGFRMMITATPELFRAMKTAGPLLSGLARTCEQCFGWATEETLPPEDGGPWEEPAYNPGQDIDEDEKSDRPEPDPTDDAFDEALRSGDSADDYPEPDDEPEEPADDDDEEPA